MPWPSFVKLCNRTALLGLFGFIVFSTGREPLLRFPVMTFASPVKTNGGFSAHPCDDLQEWWEIVEAPQELLLEESEFVIVSRLGMRRICKLTGNTRRMGSWRAATITTFDVDTVVRPLEDGTPAMWGVRGEKFAGTWAITLLALSDHLFMDGAFKIVAV